MSRIVVLAALACAGTALGQVSSTVSLSNGVDVRVVADFGRPTGQQTLTVEMARASGDSFYRIFKDQNNLAVFAYELAISRSRDGNQFYFTAKPAEAEFAAQFPNADAGKPVPSLSEDHRLQLRSGDADQVGLFEIPGMGLSVTDRIYVVVSPDGSDASTGPLRFEDLEVSINDGPELGPARAAVSGRYAMFYIPGRGGYFFSLDAPQGRAFVKTGSIDGSRLRFTVENDNYLCTSARTILENSESGEVWVFHDPAYKPAGNWTQEVSADAPRQLEFFAAASDSLSWWLR